MADEGDGRDAYTREWDELAWTYTERIRFVAGETRALFAAGDSEAWLPFGRVASVNARTDVPHVSIPDGVAAERSGTIRLEGTKLWELHPDEAILFSPPPGDVPFTLRQRWAAEYEVDPFYERPPRGLRARLRWVAACVGYAWRDAMDRLRVTRPEGELVITNVALAVEPLSFTVQPGGAG